jgi:hypothetical protein
MADACEVMITPLSVLGKVSAPRFRRGPANGKNRRVAPFAVGSSGGLLSDHIAGAQPPRRGPLFMPNIVEKVKILPSTTNLVK